MRTMFVIVCFLLMVLAPCILALYALPEDANPKGWEG